MTQTVQIKERMHSVQGVMQPQRVLIPTLDMLADKIRAVPFREVRELNEITAQLAADHGADITCPVTVQKMLKVAAVIAHSAVTLKDPNAIPFWRVVDPDGPYGEKLAGGRGFIIAQRAKEQAR